MLTMHRSIANISIGVVLFFFAILTLRLPHKAVPEATLVTTHNNDLAVLMAECVALQLLTNPLRTGLTSF